ncbi:MAG: diguanylate cyclase [Desulfobulbus propionicus]|nr:MAG: diguanylate cyclase [Desulfobulbus propionicus]
MVDLSTRYLGLSLNNPIIAGSCGLTGKLGDIRKLVAAGAGAVVLKSLFEEQILNELANSLDTYETDYPDAYDYVNQYTRDNIVGDYLMMISEAKKVFDIPVIASINCVTSSEWVSFATSVEKSGADAIEINVSLLPADQRKTSKQYEDIYFEVINKVASLISIPISLKMSTYSPALANLIARLSHTGKVGGFVLFNRYASPDIKIEAEKVTPAKVYSSPEESILPLRWIAMLSGDIKADFAASTGVHDGEAVIKQLLAGATAVQCVSTLYMNGPETITAMLDTLRAWMEKKGYASLEDFRGKLRYGKSDNPAMYERIQFMRQFSGVH